MAADETDSIAAEIDANPESVGVTAAADRDDDAPDAAGDDATPLTWGDVWQHCSLSGVVSKTQAATALEAHPESGYRSHQPARDRLQTAIENGVLVETGAYDSKLAVEEDSDEHV